MLGHGTCFFEKGTTSFLTYILPRKDNEDTLGIPPYYKNNRILL